MPTKSRSTAPSKSAASKSAPAKASKPTSGTKAPAAPKPIAASIAASEPTTASLASAWPEGLCETSEGEALYRRGFPHLRQLTDEHVDDPAAVAANAMTTLEPMLDFAWPRAVAERVARGYLGIDAKYGSPSPRDPAFLGAIQKEGPPIDANAFFETALRRDFAGTDFAVEAVVYLVEALTSADAAADAILGVLERDPSVMQRRGDALVIGRCLGFLLMRAQGADALRARLAALSAQVGSRKVAPTKFWAGLVATLVDGDAAFVHFNNALKYYAFARDRARLVDKIRTAPGEFLPDLRFVYLGGPEVLELYEKRLDELPKGGLARRFFDGLAHLKRPLAEPLMRKLASRPDVGALATAWLARG
jgi:hypothetical protein